MSKNLYVLGGVMIVLAAVSALITYFRAGTMSPPNDIATKGLAAIQRGNVLFFGVFMPLITGWISYRVWLSMQAKYGVAAQSKYLVLAIILGVIFSIMAALVFKMRGFWEFFVLHAIYVIGLGWLMPLLFLK